MKYTDKKINEFLKESNAIEGVYDDDSLVQARYAWDYLVTEKVMTPGVVLKTHKILMLHQPLLPDERGYFRKIGVRVGNDIKMDWQNIYPAIAQWCEHMNHTITLEAGQTEVETMCVSLHIQYEDIHPFVDGNGRTGRMFLNWWRVQRGISLKVIKESEKFDYYKWFQKQY